jgi:3-oxoacyl-[acyl-carrier protein] reductase
LRNVVVTGGSRGIGLGISRALAAAGYHVVAIARSESADLKGAMDEAARAGVGEISFRAFDLSDLGAIPDFVRGLRKDFGPFYGLVNNAGMGTSGVLATMPDAAIERLVGLNTLSPIVFTKYIVRSMMANKERGGRVVNVSSVVSITGYSGLSVYSATKASLVGFTRSLAREVGQLGITVNAVAPGFVDTDMTDELDAQQRERIARRSALRRLIDVEDVTHAVTFLLGDGARNITGTVVTVDAGSTA